MRDRIVIKAAPERIWMLLADPARWGEWNPKFVSVRRNRSGPVVAGEQFSMVTRLKRGESPSEVLVREVMPLRRVSVKQLFTRRNRSRHVDVRLELSANEGGIEVTQTLDHTHAFGFILNFLIWAIHRLGKPVGIPPLERLKNLAEGPA